jgi:hypothetical protein
VIIDALDEAATPAQARAIIDQVVLPLAETCSDAGAQVVVGTRRRDGGGDLLGRFGGALESIDLDDPEYFAADDLAAYALACLQLAGDERPANPWDPRTGQQRTVLEGHRAEVNDVCQVAVDGKELLASAGDDGMCGCGISRPGRARSPSPRTIQVRPRPGRPSRWPSASVRGSW